MSCRLPTFRVMTGGIFGNMFIFFEWYCDTTESLKDSFFFFHHSSCILHMYLLVVLLLLNCLGFWWLHCSFRKAAELWFCAIASPPKCSVSVLHWKHVFRTEAVVTASGTLYGRSRLELSKHHWSLALGITLFFFFLQMLSNSPSLCTRAYWVRGFKRLEKTCSSFNCVLVLCTFLSFQFGLISSGTDRTNSSTGLCVLLSGWSPFLHTTGSPTRI